MNPETAVPTPIEAGKNGEVTDSNPAKTLGEVPWRIGDSLLPFKYNKAP